LVTKNANLVQAAATWKILTISPTARIVRELSTLLQAAIPMTQVMELPVYPPRQGLQEILSSQSPDLILIDVSSDSDQAFTTIREIGALGTMANQTHPPMVVGIVGGHSPDLILRCIRQGASDFLVSPFQEKQLFDLIRSLLDKNPHLRQGARARTIVVLPAKGACGGTTVAANLAFHWKKYTGQKVLLADMDPLTGTTSFILKAKSNYSFLDALDDSRILEPELWKAIITHLNGVDILLSPESIINGVHLLTDASRIFDFARHQYDAVVVAISNPWSKWNQSILRNADEVILVTTNELPALQASQRVMAFLPTIGIPRDRCKLVINRYLREVGLSKEAVQRALIDGKPIAPGTAFAKSLAALAESLAGPVSKEAAAQNAPKKSSGIGSFLNLFSRAGK
jgi:pilus assembly protein CpaE